MTYVNAVFETNRMTLICLVSVCLRQRQRLSARQAMQHLEAGGRMYHSTLCNCCQHNAPATQSVDTDQSNSRLHGHCTNPQFTADSRPLPEQRQANNIPLDISNDASVDTASVDVFKGLSTDYCYRTVWYALLALSNLFHALRNQGGMYAILESKGDSSLGKGQFLPNLDLAPSVT